MEWKGKKLRTNKDIVAFAETLSGKEKTAFINASLKYLKGKQTIKQRVKGALTIVKGSKTWH